MPGPSSNLDRSGQGTGSTNVNYPTSNVPNSLDQGAQTLSDILQGRADLAGLQNQSQFTQLTDAFGGALSSLGGLLSSLLGGGRGGRGKSAKDIGEELGLKRDEINAQRNYLTENAVFGQRDIDLQNQMLQLQKQQGQENFAEQNKQFVGSEAARGAIGTAGVGAKHGFLQQQFNDLMARLGINQAQVGLGQQENDAKFNYAFQKNNFAQQNLDLSAGQAGFQSPFSIPNPVPVQPKK